MDLSLIEEVDICLPSAKIDDSLPNSIRKMTGIRCFTDRGGDSMAKHIVVQHPLDRLAVSRYFTTKVEPLSKLLETRWTGQHQLPKCTVISVYQLLVDTLI